jgi:predicted transcriptional regulator
VGAKAPGRVALLSIHPAYAEAIFDGRKLVEFRRVAFAQEVSTVVVYATQPVGRVVGWFEVEDIVQGTPTSLWRRFSKCAGIDRASYLAYFTATERAFGIRVRRPVRLDTPRALVDLVPNLRPPQSFRYLPEASLAALAR